MSIPKKMNDYKIEDSMSFEEPIVENLKYLNIIKDNFDGVYDLIGKFKDKSYKQIEDKKVVLTLIKKRLNNKYNQFTYESKNGGRLIPDGHSLCFMNKILRHTLVGDLCYDIDIHNAHPTFLLWIAKHNDRPCKHLENYINNRDDFLDTIQECYGLSQDESKNFILSLLFDQNKNPEPESPVYDFYQEILSLQSFVSETFKDIFKKSKKGNNQKGSCLSNFLQMIENKVCQCMIEICKNNNIKVYAPCFDGCLLDKNDVDLIGLDELIEKIEIELKDKLDISIILKSKSMTLGINEELDDIEKRKIYTINKNLESLTWIDTFIFDITDNYSATIFSEHSNGEMFYTTGHGWVIFNNKTYMWDVGCCKSKLVDKICSFFSKHVIEKYDNFNCEDKDFNKLIKSTIKHVGSSKFGTDVLKQLQGKLTEENEIMDKFNNKPNLIPFKDGNVIDLYDNGNVKKIVKEDYLTLNVGYDLPMKDDIIYNNLTTILRGLVKTYDDYRSLMSVLSLFIFGDNTNEIFPCLTGVGGNGKGLILTLLMSCLGCFAKSINSKRLTVYDKSENGTRADPELFACRNARVVFASEIDENEKSELTLLTPTIKKWTGRDPITCRDLNKSTISYIPKFTLTMLCNDLPKLSINDGGIKRRMKVIHFPFNFIDGGAVPKDYILKENEKIRDESLKDLMKSTEYKGNMILLLVENWLLNKGRYYQSESNKIVTNDYFTNLNVIREWFFENYDLDDTKRTPLKHIKANYNSSNPPIISDSIFTKYLIELCPGHVKIRGIRHYKCVRKITEEDD